MTMPDPPTIAAPVPAPAPAPEPTHPCVRCGRPVPIGTAMCDSCNPLGLADPAASQVHGTAFVALGIAILVIALVARFALSGIGPFDARIAGVAVTADAAGTPAGLAITLAVTNRGTKGGASTCRVHDVALLSSDVSAIFLSPEIPAGESATFTRQTSLLGVKPVTTLTVDCSQP
ncbi:MAG: hypothetical protein ACYDAK_03915 [Candidatus Limnocylindrales bacterium]